MRRRPASQRMPSRNMTMPANMSAGNTMNVKMPMYGLMPPELVTCASREIAINTAPSTTTKPPRWLTML